MYSLKTRITRNLTLNMIVVMSALLIIMYFFMQQLLQDYVLTRLENDAESLISALEQDSNQEWRIIPGRMSAVYDRVRSGHYYEVDVDGQRLASRSLFDGDFPSTGSGKEAGHYLVRGPGSEDWLVWVQQVDKKGQTIKIWMVEDINPIQTQLQQYTFYALALVLLVTVILIYLQQRTLRQSFYVFEWLRKNLTSLRHGDSNNPEIQIPAEIAPLVTEIEKLVMHLRLRIERTRHAIGNLAHELKRPIQLLSIQLDNKQNQVLADSLSQIKYILERELKRARISGSSKAGGDFDVADEIPAMLDVMRKIYPDIQINSELGAEMIALQLDRDDMLELIGNLLDNACKFASSQAKLLINASQDWLSIVIEDDGHGLETRQLEEIKQRGVRLDESVAGHGLGLGICNDIIDTYEGKISFAESHLGGLEVSVGIPLSYLDSTSALTR